MRHAKKRTRLNLTQGEMKGMILNLTRSLFKYQRITTTQQKAKVARSVIERILSIAKQDTLHNRRKIFKKVNDHELVKKIFEKYAPLFNGITGGYTRILRLRRRRGDDALLVIFEFTKKLAEEKPVDKEKKEKKEKVVKQATPAASEKIEETEKVKGPTLIEKKERPPVKRAEKKEGKKQPGFMGGVGKFFRPKQEP
jgi:large subunit ribosomal protein L17